MELIKGTGRKCDVIIEDLFIPDMFGKMIPTDVILIIADPGFKEIIQKVEGVNLVAPGIIASTYQAVIDHRYDREFVKKEIEAAILCGNPGQVNIEAGLRVLK